MKPNRKEANSLKQIHKTTTTTSSSQNPEQPKTGLFNGWKVTVVEAWHTFVDAVKRLFGYGPGFQDSNTERTTPQAGEVTKPDEQPLQNRLIASESSVSSVVNAEKRAESIKVKPAATLPEQDTKHETVEKQENAEAAEEPESDQASPPVSIGTGSVQESVITEGSDDSPETSVTSTEIIPTASLQPADEGAVSKELKHEIEICELLASPPKQVTEDAAGQDIKRMNFCAYLDGSKEAVDAGWPFGIDRKYQFQEYLHVARLGKGVVDSAGTDKEKKRLEKFFKKARKQVPQNLESAGIEKHFGEITVQREGGSSAQPAPQESEVTRQAAKTGKKKKQKNAARAAQKNPVARGFNRRRQTESAFDKALSDLVKENPAVVNLWVHHYQNQQAGKEQE